MVTLSGSADTGAGPFDLVVFSPHLDDAALSCGGKIAAAVRAGRRVLVATVFSGDPTPQGRRGGGALSAFSGMRSRREEDRAALGRLGSAHLWLDYEEAIWRDRRYQSFLGMMGPVRASDSTLKDDLEARVRRICTASPAAELLFPLGVGGHVDHRILHGVSRRLLAASVERSRIAYYEEIPYALVPFLVEHGLRAVGARLAPGAIPPDLAVREAALPLARRAARAIVAVPIIGREIRPYQRPLLGLLVALLVLGHRLGRSRADLPLQAELVDITQSAQDKAEAIACYASQVPELFGDLTAWREAALAYSSRIGGAAGRLVERYWRPA